MAELEFRDGKREVPDHLADMMSGLEVHRLTFDEAVNQANERLVRDRLNKEMDRVIETHFRFSR